MDLSAEQLEALADKIADRFRKDRPALVAVTAESGGAAPVVQLPPEFYREQAEFRAEMKGVNRRLDDLMSQMNTRFDDLIHQMDKRFDQMNDRFDDLIHQMDKRFEQTDKRFEQMDNRFGDLIHQMDKRFEQVDKRFESMQWMMGFGFTLIVVLMSVYEFIM